jgi:prepilin-type N-terminal cleavage/methylation domain-containing protein
MHDRLAQSGFTPIELSMVLIIIGAFFDSWTVSFGG